MRSIREANPDLWGGDDDGHARDIFFGGEKLPKVPTGPSAYGLLRSPWNLNGSPEVARFDKGICGAEHAAAHWPRCATHRDAVIASKMSLRAFLVATMGKAHGVVHMMLGGAEGCSAKTTRPSRPRRS